MYQKAYGIIETLAPLHIGASAGEETGNLNLIFRDQFTQTGNIPGSSIRGRFRADMREKITIDNPEIDRAGKSEEEFNKLKKEREIKVEKLKNETERKWYGHEATPGAENATTEANVKFEYASLVWLPVFCPGQPIVWVSCPRLLRRYQQITGITAKLPEPYTAPKALQSRQVGTNHRVLFFNLGFIEIEHEDNLSAWIPKDVDVEANNLLVVANNDIAMLHDMALYRQSRVKLGDEEKKVEKERFLTWKLYQKEVFWCFPLLSSKQVGNLLGKEKNPRSCILVDWSRLDLVIVG